MVNDVYGAPFVRGHRYWKWMPFMPNSRPGVKICQIEDEEDLEKLKVGDQEKKTEYEDYEEVKEEIKREDSIQEEVENTKDVSETEDVEVQSGLPEKSSVEPIEEQPKEPKPQPSEEPSEEISEEPSEEPEEEPSEDETSDL